MATIVKLHRVCDNEGYIFRTDNEMELIVYSFERGIATLGSKVEHSITSFIGMIVGCFDENSNFESELLKAFNCNEKNKLSGIQFKFDDERLLVTVEKKDNEKNIMAKWIKNDET